MSKNNSISIKDNFNFGRFSDFAELNDLYKLGSLKERTYLLSDICIEKNIISLSNNTIKDKEKDLVLKIIKDKENKNTFVQTGNFIGNFKIEEKKQISITSRFSDVLLMRMLNVANNVFLQDVKFDTSISDSEKQNNIVKYIIGYLFIQSLEKAYLHGVPKSYKTMRYHESQIHGNIDVNQFIRKDIPFAGKISSISREQKFVTEIIDVLHTAIKSVESIFSSDIMHRISNVRNFLKQNYSGRYTDSSVIDKAMNHKALNNAIYSEYKRVLNFAKILIEIKSIENTSKPKTEYSGYLIDVSELWELYLSNLLSHSLSDTGWTVEQQYSVKVYEGKFYEREIRPDIVLINHFTDKKAVFDAKYKKMNYNKGIGDGTYGDLDRSDFFQIHTYMSYFNKDNELIAGGLLYPFETKFDKDKSHSNYWIGGSGKFIVDGIDLSGFESIKEPKEQIEELVKQEKKFIDSISKILK